MSRCSVCRAPVRYEGQRVRAYELSGELHICRLPRLARALQCACGALVTDLPDGRRTESDGRAHTHYDVHFEPPPWDYMEEAPIDAPYPSEPEQAAPQRRDSYVPPRKRPPRFTGGVNVDDILSEE